MAFIVGACVDLLRNRQNIGPGLTWHVLVMMRRGAAPVRTSTGNDVPSNARGFSGTKKSAGTKIGEIWQCKTAGMAKKGLVEQG